MEDSGLGLLLKNGYRSQWNCLWGVPEQGQAGSGGLREHSACSLPAPPTTLSLQISVFVSCTGSFLAMSKP